MPDTRTLRPLAAGCRNLLFGSRDPSDTGGTGSAGYCCSVRRRHQAVLAEHRRPVHHAGELPVESLAREFRELPFEDMDTRSALVVAVRR